MSAPETAVRDFLELCGIRWGGRLAVPIGVAEARRGNPDYRVHQVRKAPWHWEKTEWIARSSSPMSASRSSAAR